MGTCHQRVLVGACNAGHSLESLVCHYHLLKCWQTILASLAGKRLSFIHSLKVLADNLQSKSIVLEQWFYDDVNHARRHSGVERC